MKNNNGYGQQRSNADCMTNQPRFARINRTICVAVMSVAGFAGCATTSATSSTPPTQLEVEQASRVSADRPQSKRQRAPAIAFVHYAPPHEDVLFDFDSTAISLFGQHRLDKWMQQIADWKLEVLVVTGNADHLGVAAYNDALSVRRALAVRALLVSKGIPAYRIYTEGRGTRNRITIGCNEHVRMKAIACLAPDRRVEIDVVGVPKQQVLSGMQ
jgi:outer membrane protein OmpA-like peptidoglycan-associated protein